MLLGESGATFHRGKLSHSHCKWKTLIVIDFSDKFERNTPKRFKNIVSSFSWLKFAFSLGLEQVTSVTSRPTLPYLFCDLTE